MNQKFSAKAIQRCLWMGAILAGTMAASADTQVSFQVDMTAQVTAGTFTNGNGTVAAHGSFDGWGSGVNLTNNPAGANTNLYTGTADDADDANGTVLIYKYVLNGTYENTADSQNRCAQLPAGGGSLLLPAAFYNDAGPMIAANVTFQVDMAEQVYLGLFKTNSSVEVRGSFQGWSGGSTLTNVPTIRTTNANGVVSSNVYVGTFAATGSTNGTAEFKYVLQPGTDWENPSANDSDRDNGNNRFFSISTQTLPIVSFGDAALSFPQVTFQVDMTEQVTGGTFVPGTDTVSAHGTFNGWGAGVNLTNNPAAANTNLYTGTTFDATDANGGVLIYKYVTNGTGYENTTDADNRCAQLPAGGGSLLLPAAFFSDAGPGITANVTFQVDMAEQIQLGNFDTNTGAFVEVNGFFSGWGSAGTLSNDPTIMTTNSTGIVTSNVYVGTFEITGSTNGTEEFKYVINGSDWESPLASDSDGDTGNRFFGITSQTLPIVPFSDKPLIFNTVTNAVTFEIDMTTQIESGAFATNSNTVEIHGDFNGWGSGQTMTNDPASSTPDIYSTVITYVDTGGAEHFFKYVVQPNTVWETVSAANEAPGTQNRYLYLLQTSGSFTNGPVYFSDEPPSTLIDFVTVTNCMVTFTVNMTNATGTGPGGTATFDNAYPSSDSVWLNGLFNGNNNSFWTWGQAPVPGGQPGYQMTQISNTMLFTITLPVNSGQNADLTYKYSINGWDVEAASGVNHLRWIRSLPNYTMPVDTYGSQPTELSFGDLGIAAAVGKQIDISWLGRRGVHLQTAPSLNPGTVWTDLDLTDGTNLLVAPGGMAGTNYTIGSGNLFFRLVGPQ